MKFKPGDVCVVVDHPSCTASDRKYIGRECTVIAYVGAGYGRRGVVYYQVEGLNPLRTIASENVLRLKRPPEHPDNVASWDACPWRPGQQREPYFPPGMHPEEISAAALADIVRITRMTHPILEIVRDELADLFPPTQGKP